MGSSQNPVRVVLFTGGRGSSVLSRELIRSERIALTLAISTFVWLITPMLLLGRRLRWQRLLPSALLSAIGMAGVGIWSVIWMPHTLASSAKQFGVIGIAFAMLTWFVAAAFVVVIATTGGAMIAERISRRWGPPEDA